MRRNGLRAAVAAGAAVLVLVSLGALRACAEDKDLLQPVERLTLVDSNGKRIGSVQGLRSEQVTVAIKAKAELIILNATAYGFTGDGGGFVREGSFYFESANCGGTPYSTDGGGDRIRTVAPVHQLDRVLVFSFESSSKKIIAKSQGSVSNPASCQPLGPFEQMATPMRLLVDLSKEFTPPFALK